jgi:hypothetical protein
MIAADARIFIIEWLKILLSSVYLWQEDVLLCQVSYGVETE